MSVIMLSYAFWRAELFTIFRSLNKSTNRILNESESYINTNSTKLSDVTFIANSMTILLYPSIMSKMMLSCIVSNNKDLQILFELNKVIPLSFSELTVFSFNFEIIKYT